MAREFRLPDPGEGIHEAEILDIYVSAGDTVQEGDIVLHIETDKAAVELPSPFTGVVEEIKVKTGDVVQVGDVLMTFAEVAGEEIARKVRVKAPEKPPEAARVAQPQRAPEILVPASPATRRLAQELGVDLHGVSGSGPGGRVTADDVHAFASKAKEEEQPPERKLWRPLIEEVPPLPDFSRWGPVERVPLRGIRRVTAKQMALAWSQIPHVTHQDIADITELEAFRRRHKNVIEQRGGKLSLTVLVMPAVVAALKQFPHFNATLDAETGEIVLKRYYHFGVAVDTEGG